MKSIKIMLGCLLAIFFFISIYFYFHISSNLIVSHWNAQGQADGSMSKFWGLFLLPVATFAIALLLFFIPKIDPLKKNVRKFRNYYDGFILIFVLFMLLLQIQVILWNIGIQISMNLFMPIAFAILFFYTGILLEHSKRNWFIGIRTPWTLSSDKIWDKTHKLGGRLFKISALISLIGILFQKYAILLIIVPAVFAAVYSVLYSYFEFKKQKFCQAKL
jgi:uncharacterized membrane protein